MSRMTFKIVTLVALALSGTTLLTGCETKGPAQRAGESLDQAGKNIKDAVDPRGPVEKAGSKVDEAVGNK